MAEHASDQQQPLRFATIDQLEVELRAAGFDTTEWGDGATKRVDDLWEELESGETELSLVDGELVRKTYVAGVDVYAESGGQWYRLVEEKQVFANGAERRRELASSIAEKMRPQESIEEAAHRALQEELGVTGPVSVSSTGEDVIQKASQSFGGMQTKLHRRTASVQISEQDFRPEGYVERQPDKSIYFVWQPVESTASTAEPLSA